MLAKCLKTFFFMEEGSSFRNEISNYVSAQIKKKDFGVTQVYLIQILLETSSDTQVVKADFEFFEGFLTHFAQLAIQKFREGLVSLLKEKNMATYNLVLGE